ncbi:MAG: NFYB/HAP3 family transcription factor subunit [Candidatus Aenigmatarchaeota archaeon]|nr:NFYB/HAP3 family transcription factor subunit [Candidatus Aenigmarchaeota archaeon]
MEIAKNSIKRIVKKIGVKRVGDDAAIKLAEIVENKGIEICKKALELAKISKRKTVLRKDIREATR